MAHMCAYAVCTGAQDNLHGWCGCVVVLCFSDTSTCTHTCPYTHPSKCEVLYAWCGCTCMLWIHVQAYLSHTRMFMHRSALCLCRVSSCGVHQMWNDEHNITFLVCNCAQQHACKCKLKACPLLWYLLLVHTCACAWISMRTNENDQVFAQCGFFYIICVRICIGF